LIAGVAAYRHRARRLVKVQCLHHAYRLSRRRARSRSATTGRRGVWSGRNWLAVAWGAV